MRTPRSSARYKRCPKCQALLRTIAEFCPHCGSSLPGSFPHGPLVPAETSKVVKELKGDVAPQRPVQALIAARYLILVARDREDLWEYFRQTFAAETGIEVRYERRLVERRQWAARKPLDRRGRDRRAQPPLYAELRRFGFAIVKKA